MKMPKTFGNTLVFLFLLLIFLIGAQMLLKISIPWLHTVDSSLAHAIETTVH